MELPDWDRVRRPLSFQQLPALAETDVIAGRCFPVRTSPALNYL